MEALTDGLVYLGAAAVLAAMRIISSYGTDEVISQLCTFGQPRCMVRAPAEENGSHCLIRKDLD